MTQGDPIKLALAIAQQFGLTVASEDAPKLVALFRKAYSDGAAAEREACAKVVEDTKDWKGGGWISTLSPQTKTAIAAAIRARGQS